MKLNFITLKTLALLLVLVSCNDNESTKPNDPSLIDQAELVILHDGVSKKWKVSSYYKNYNNLELDNDLTLCTGDEVYTFFKDTDEANVILGNNSCFENNTNVESEVAVASYSYNKETQKLYLTFTRGYNTKINSSTSVTIITNKCVLLTEDKMIFAGDNDGVGIVFKKVN